MATRTWFITGISGGLAPHMAEQLLTRGDRVAGTVRRLETVQDLKASHGDRLWLAQLNGTDTPAVRRRRRGVPRPWPYPRTRPQPPLRSAWRSRGATDDQIAHQIATNLTGSIQVARAALPHLRAQGGGRIIQISTMGGQATFPGGALYHTSKWGVEGFMDALRQDVGVLNIGVSIVEPGSARTEFRGNLQMAARVR